MAESDVGALGHYLKSAPFHILRCFSSVHVGCRYVLGSQSVSPVFDGYFRFYGCGNSGCSHVLLLEGFEARNLFARDHRIHRGIALLDTQNYECRMRYVIIVFERNS